jgi:O-methyltransferase/methyltransferase family protein
VSVDAANLQARLLGYVTGFFASQAVIAAAELGIADAIAAGAGTAEEVAGRVGSEPASTYRLLRALAGLGLFSEDRDRRFQLTSSGELLRTDVPGTLRDYARMQRDHYVPWGRLTEAVRTGRSAFDLTYGQPVFDWLAAHPQSAAIFDRAMSNFTATLARHVASRFDFSAYPTVVDLGGGVGELLAEILVQHPSVRGVLADLPHVLERGRAYLTSRGLVARVTFQPIDFFAAVGGCGDLYLMKSVLHDWNDEQSLSILKNVRAAGSRLLLVERVMPEPGEPLDPRGPLFDLNMMALTGGRERTASEWRELLANAGFSLTGITALPADLSLIDATGEPR